jgi:hypothetical protein
MLRACYTSLRRSDCVHFADIRHGPRQPSFRHFVQDDPNRLVDFEVHGGVNLHPDQDNARVVGRAVPRIAFVREPGAPIGRVQRRDRPFVAGEPRNS